MVKPCQTFMLATRARGRFLPWQWPPCEENCHSHPAQHWSIWAKGSLRVSAATRPDGSWLVLPHFSGQFQKIRDNSRRSAGRSCHSSIGGGCPLSWRQERAKLICKRFVLLRCLCCRFMVIAIQHDRNGLPDRGNTVHSRRRSWENLTIFNWIWSCQFQERANCDQT